MNRLSNGERDDLGDSLRHAATAAWEKTCDGVWQVPLSSGYPSRLFSESVKLLGADRTKLDVAELSFLNSTGKTKAHVLYHESGQQMVLREGCRMDSVRSNAPCVVQPFHHYISSESYRCVDVLPYIAMTECGDPCYETKPVRQDVSIFLPDKEIAHIQKMMLRDVWKMAANISCLRRDIGLMPNGTPLQVDPEAVDGTAGVMLDYKQALSDTWDFQNDMNLPSEMHYVDRNGKMIQEKIFPNPF